MSSCDENEARIHKLVEHELRAEDEDALKLHIASCMRCSEKMREYERMKSYVEDKFGAEIHLTSEDEFILAAMSAKPSKRSHGLAWKLMKIGLLSTAAVLAITVVGAFLFVKFYFGRTFPNQLSNVVLRCSEGLKVQDGSGDWAPLKRAHRLRNGTRIRTPDDTRSFVSFNGIRILSGKASEFEIRGGRKIAFVRGDLAIESAKKRRPLEISAGSATLSTGGSSIRISGEKGVYSIACISGTAHLKPSDTESVSILEPGKLALITSGRMQISASRVEDLFAFKRVQVLERIKERFLRIIAKYTHNLPARLLGRHDFRTGPLSGKWEDGLQFVSYVEGGLAAAINPDVTQSAADYYNSLFVPSNRSITIGRQRVVRLDPGEGASFPRWSNDGSMIGFVQTLPGALTGIVRVVRLDDLENPWDVSQDYGYAVRSMFPLTWTPDDRHVLFQVETGPTWDERGPTGNFALKIAPIDPAEGPLRDFNSPFYDIPLPLPLPVGKTISPGISKLPWGDAMVCANWGNLAYIPVEEDGQAVWGARGLFLTNFNPRHAFVMGGGFSPSGKMMDFTAVEDLDFNRMNSYILYDVEDILDGFTQPPRTLDDPRIKRVAPTDNVQFTGGFSYDESLVFVHEDVNHAFDARYPTVLDPCDFDIFYTSALPGEPGKPVQIHIPGNQMFLQPSPEGNRICYSNFEGNQYELRVVSFDIEADIDNDLGGVLIDNSGTSLIVPPGTLERNFRVKISTPFSIGEEAVLSEGEDAFFAMRLISAEGLENPRFSEPMTLTIRYTDNEVAGLDEGMLEIYYYDESDPEHPGWVPLGGTVDPEHNEITVDVRHFSKFAVGPRMNTGSK